MRNDGSVDLKEVAVLEVLRDRGPCDTGDGTYSFRKHPMGSEAGVAVRVQLVDRATCRRLEKAGLVAVDAAGRAELTDAGRKELARG